MSDIHTLHLHSLKVESTQEVQSPPGCHLKLCQTS